MKLLEVGLGKTYSTIQSAIDAIPTILDDWYKILVYSGTYNGFTVSNKSTAYITKYILIVKNTGDTVIINSDIYIESNYVYIEDFKIDSATVFFALNSDYSIIRKCELYNSIGYSVVFNGSLGAEVKRCLFHDSISGIMILNGSKNYIRSNIIRDLDEIGIFNGNEDQVFIINNTIDNTNLGIEFYGNQDIIIRNNNITNNNLGIKRNIGLSDLSIKSNNNVWNNINNYVDTSFGENAFSFDPKYTDYNNRDFSLISDSPCIDRGTYINAPDNDYNGISRPRLTGFDIGAFEYRLANLAPSITIESVSQRNNGSGMVDIAYNGIDENYDICNLNLYEYSLTGDFIGEEQIMTISIFDSLHDRIDNLAFTFTGSQFNFVWDAFEDLGSNFEGNVYIRIRANDGEFNSNIVSDIVYIDTKKPIITYFAIDSSSEEEENVTINGIVNLNISCIGAISMKFSNNGIEWSSYEPYYIVKNWNLISGNGGQPFQSLKRVYIKVKDNKGNETDGLLFDTTWYKKSIASVENLTTNNYTHSISKALEDANDGDIIEIQSDETFFDSFTINKNNITIRNGTSFKPTIDMTDRNAITIENVSDVILYGFLFIESNDRLIEIINSNNIVLQYNIFEHENCLRCYNCSNLFIDRNIFKNGYKAVELNSCTSIINNNQFIRMLVAAIELEDSPSKIINNHFIETYNCIDNLFPNDDSSIVRNNIFYNSKGIVINANPTWIIDHNNFWENKKEYMGLVDRWDEYQNFKADPKFVNIAEDNYYLMFDSPCIDRGSFKDAPDHDFNNNVRKQDINFDIGAFEYAPISEYIFNIDNILSSNDVKNVFIYDTNKDNISNSWHDNFPEIACLIATNEGLYIADSDSKELFMKFEQGLDNVINNDTPLKGLFALDGIIYISNGESGGLIVIDFINDRILNITSNGTYEYNSNISDRNNGSGFSYLNSNHISGTDIRDIDVAYIENNTYVAVATNNNVCIIKNLDTILSYGNSNEINRLFLTDNARLYYIDYVNSSNNITVFYDIDEDTVDREIPNYIYDTTNEFGPKLFSTVINDLTVVEEDSTIKRGNIESNTIYVATDNGINVLYTCEDTKAHLNEEESEKWGYSIKYLLKEDYNPISEITTPNLLEANNGNHDFEDGTITPDNWTALGYPLYSKTGNDSFLGNSAIRVCFNNSYTSDILIPIEGNTKYIFGAAIKADQFDSKAVIHIDWYDSEENFISTTLLDIGTDIYYRKYYSNLKSPIIGSEYEPTNGYAKIVLDGDGLDSNKRFWFDSIEFYEGSADTDIKSYVLDGSNRNIDFINVSEDILLFVTKELNNDQIYLYNRYDLKIKMRRSTNLPSRNISSLFFNKTI